MARKRTLVPQKPVPKLTISQKVEAPEEGSFDSSGFDKVEPKTVNDLFQKHYKKHLEFITNIVVSRVSMTTALANMQEYINNEMGSALEVNDDVMQSKIDGVFANAIELYAVAESLSFAVDDATKHQIIVNYTDKNAILARAIAQKQAGPAGVSAGASVADEINHRLDGLQHSIEDKLGRKLEKDGNDPYGNTAKSKSKFKNAAIRSRGKNR